MRILAHLDIGTSKVQIRWEGAGWKSSKNNQVIQLTISTTGTLSTQVPTGKREKRTRKWKLNSVRVQNKEKRLSWEVWPTLTNQENAILFSLVLGTRKESTVKSWKTTLQI